MANINLRTTTTFQQRQMLINDQIAVNHTEKRKEGTPIPSVMGLSWGRAGNLCLTLASASAPPCFASLMTSANLFDLTL